MWWGEWWPSKDVYSTPRSMCMCYSHGKADIADVIKVKDFETGKIKPFLSIVRERSSPIETGS